MITTIIIKVIVGYLALMLVIRLLGNKELSEVTPFDFVFIIILGGILTSAIYDDKVSIWVILITIGAWTVLNVIVNFLVRMFEKLRPVIKGEPAIVVNNGCIEIKELQKKRIDPEQLRSLLRQQGVFTLREVKYALLEPGGQISIMKKESAKENSSNVLSHLLVDKGSVKEKALDKIGKDEQWVIKSLKDEGYENLKKIYYAEWDEENGFLVQTYD
ncbi:MULTISPECIES: DUF421 domain-containing protein [Solibacillus]|uniref:DUF421 domain-containing protein n=1 Tax=Solibacillus merdavium TaxID=2762218 RepID=A0ABR8XN45_9BACL|nr:DUF421 domain-containing protein [Solibacillus merdavium]MBD8033358.1 DUF421 domain-containing protein [Solibacillus merdavium]